MSRTIFAPRAAAILYNLLCSLGKPDELVLLPANVCPIVPLALLLAQQRFEFFDIESTTLCADGEALLSRIQQTDQRPVIAVLYVRTYGAMRDKRGLFEAIRSENERLLLIDDRCCCRPEPDRDATDWNGADVLLYSTGYGKYVDLGSGGLGHLRDGVPYEVHPRRYDVRAVDALTASYKQRIVERRPFFAGEWPTDAAVWRHNDWLATEGPAPSETSSTKLLQTIDQAAEHKARINDVYRELVPRSVQLGDEFHDWRFQLIVEDRDRLLCEIEAAGHFASDHYYPSSRLFGDRTAPNAERLHRSVLNLFNDFYIDELAAREVATRVREHVTRTPDRPAARDRP